MTATAALRDYLDWPGVVQVFRVERVRRSGGRVERESSYGVTSLPPERADAEELLGLVRNHWGIENNPHRVRDVAMGEDACRVRSGDAPQVLAAARSCVLKAMRNMTDGVTSAMRRFAALPLEAFKLIRRRVKL